MQNDEELKRILDMVESGKISAAEAARLMETTRKGEPAGLRTCPYCAEAISNTDDRCPECSSNLDRPVPPLRGSGFQSLSGLGKVLVVYTLLVSGSKLLSLFFSFGFGAGIGVLLSALGLAAGIMILKNRSGGWGLGILWAALQIVTVIIHGEIINQQLFHIGMNFHTNGQGLGINLVGIILLILFIKAKPANNEKRGL